MKWAIPALTWVLSLAGAFLLGRLSLSDDGGGEVGSPANHGASEDGFRTGPTHRRTRWLSQSEALRRQSVPGQLNDALVGKLSTALRDPSVVTRLPAWMELLEAARPEDMPGILALIEEARAQGRYDVDEADAFWTQWGLLDGEGALHLLESREDIRFSDARYRVAQAWASKDPLGALHWIESRPESPFAVQMFDGALKGWAERDLASATSYLLAAPEDSALRAPQIAQGLAWTLWHSGGGIATAEWYDHFAADPRADQNIRRSALETVLEGWSRVDEPVETAAFLRQHEGLDYCDPQSAQRLVMRYASRDPEVAVTFLENMGGDWTGRNPQSVDPVVARWVTKDPAGPGDWLTENPEAEVYDRVAASYAAAIRSIDPDASAEWVESIGDPALRQQVLEKLGE